MPLSLGKLTPDPSGSFMNKTRVGHTNRNLFPERVGLYEGCRLSLILFVVLVDNIDKSGRVSSSAKDVVLFECPSNDLQCVLEWFTAASQEMLTGSKKEIN
ncbi:hypothetical protein AMECASPLE_007525 [Ameca splendens]|uniref:Uncharacterized protein n=1 Tax=Ameca splendens TaxID=208324 RepID=A0ABV0YLU3_9TELE